MQRVGCVKNAQMSWFCYEHLSAMESEELFSLSRIQYICSSMSRLPNMDHTYLIAKLAKQLRERRIYRGFTQARLAELAGLTRQKVIAVEQGSLSVSMLAYAKVVGALDCELAVIPAAMPTLEELGEIF